MARVGGLYQSGTKEEQRRRSEVEVLPPTVTPRRRPAIRDRDDWVVAEKMQNLDLSGSPTLPDTCRNPLRTAPFTPALFPRSEPDPFRRSNREALVPRG